MEFGPGKGVGMGIGRRILFAVKNWTDLFPGRLSRSSIDLTLDCLESFVWSYGSTTTNT